MMCFLYEFKAPFSLKLLLILSSISFISFFIILIVYGHNQYVGFLLLAPVGIIILYSIFFKKIGLKIIGEISFNKNDITIYYYTQTKEIFEITNLEKMIIEYEGYMNEYEGDMLFPFAVNSGRNNTIIIYKKNGDKVETDFLVKNHAFLRLIINMWKNHKEPKIEIILKKSRKRIFKNYKPSYSK